MPPIHPGEILLEDFLKPLGLSQYRLAQDIGGTPIRINQIVSGQRAITVDTPMRLTCYFATSAAVWLRLQVRAMTWRLPRKPWAIASIAR